MSSLPAFLSGDGMPAPRITLYQRRFTAQAPRQAVPRTDRGSVEHFQGCRHQVCRAGRRGRPPSRAGQSLPRRPETSQGAPSSTPCAAQGSVHQTTTVGGHQHDIPTLLRSTFMMIDGAKSLTRSRVRALSEPLRGTLPHSARTTLRNACSDPYCACCIPLRSRGTLSRRARKWPACVRRPSRSTLLQAGKCRRIPNPARYSAPFV